MYSGLKKQNIWGFKYAELKYSNAILKKLKLNIREPQIAIIEKLEGINSPCAAVHLMAPISLPIFMYLIEAYLN